MKLTAKIYLVPLGLLTLLAAVSAAEPLGLVPESAAPKPLKALLIAGGCCHDYEKQHKVLYEGIQKRANIRVDVVWTREEGHDPEFLVFKDPNWAKGYDFIIHDECAAMKKDAKELTNILNAHKTIPAVHLHCAMHSFRASDNEWAKHVGIKSDRHGPHVPVSVEFVNHDHPITAPLKDWVTGKEELYNNVEVYGAEPLALGTQKYMAKGKQVTDTSIVIWTNTKSGAPSFSTSLGHYTQNVEDPRYLDLVTRGSLWVCGKLDKPSYHAPYTGSNLVREVEPEHYNKNAKAKAKPAQAAKPPANALYVKSTAKSSQTGQGKHAWCAVDGDPKSRWCGASADMPTWLQIELEKPADLSAAEIVWEIGTQWMQYTIETSSDGKTWTRSFDASSNNKAGVNRDTFSAKAVRFVKVNILKQEKGMWPSLYELRLFGADGNKLPIFPRVFQEIKKAPEKVAPSAFKDGGNIRPVAHRLSPSEEAELLKDVTVPDGFEASLFAPWQMANYPTGVAAAPNGDLYVSSDGNASGNKNPGRGRVVRLRDTDADGRADQVTEFVRDIDSPRGILWDHDRLYVLHPPHITVFHDKDGDGVADSSQRLISNIAFGFKDRPADHTTNGLEMGVDGWIYIAVGDFGFMKATGLDGRSLRMRGGGVVRFRPDGTGLETFSDGTRNIYGLAVTPTLELFARDNTNDGAGWNTRFHHLSGLEDHGYPRLYKNFSDETIAPIADYGGGSGVGAFYLDEPGIPAKWNKSPYTLDWGRLGSFQHTVEPMGSTFKETSAPKLFFKMTRPTDGDVDGNSAIYQASWKGDAQFRWDGPKHGYIAKMVPSNFTPKPLPDFAQLSDLELVKLLQTSPSHVRRLSAQRMLLRRPQSAATTDALLALVKDKTLELDRRSYALFAIAQRGLDSSMSDPTIKLLSSVVAIDDPLHPLVTRALGDMAIDLRTAGKSSPVPTALLEKSLNGSAPREILEAMITAARQGKSELAPAIAKHLASKDEALRHTAYRSIAKLENYQSVLPLLDSADERMRIGASWALMRMHKPEVVSALLAALESQKDQPKRQQILATLCRLYHVESEWKGESWSTRPDSRGPYYQLSTWDQSARILEALNGLLDQPDLSSEAASALVSLIGKNRIQNDKGLDKILKLAAADASLIPTAVAQLAAKKDVPAKALPLVIQAASSAESPPTTLQQSIHILLESDDKLAFPAIMEAFASLQSNKQASKIRDDLRLKLSSANKLENHTHTFAEVLKNGTNPAKGTWAAQALLQLANGKAVGPEAQELARSVVDQLWPIKQKKILLMDAAFWTRNPYLNDRIGAALVDSDKQVAAKAQWASRRLQIQKPGADKTAKIASLKPEDAIKQASAYKAGSAALGEAIFTRANCNACHTVHESEQPKGPFLGSIAETYQRAVLAEAIILPNKSIAQGFASNMFTLKDGKAHMGFVTDESGDSVTLRDITSAEHTFNKSDISKRDKLPTSLMPPGLVNNFTVREFASLLDYLEALSKKQH